MSTHFRNNAPLEKLLHEAQTGSRQALGAVFERYRGLLLRQAREELPEEVQAKNAPSDLVQDSFLEAQRDFSQFRGHSGEELHAWLRQILHRNAANVIRAFRAYEKRQVAREVSLDDNTEMLARRLRESLRVDAPSPSDEIQAQEETARFRRAFAKLSHRQQDVIRLRFWNRYHFDTIACVLGCSDEAARKILVRALRELGELLS